uniref:Uncharacterized protein n=1 Tax=Rhizophora mucronata TaxID=61149 RepID=A0A2P2K0I3_RHIMU
MRKIVKQTFNYNEIYETWTFHPHPVQLVESNPYNHRVLDTMKKKFHNTNTAISFIRGTFLFLF